MGHLYHPTLRNDSVFLKSEMLPAFLQVAGILTRRVGSPNDSIFLHVAVSVLKLLAHPARSLQRCRCFLKVAKRSKRLFVPDVLEWV